MGHEGASGMPGMGTKVTNSVRDFIKDPSHTAVIGIRIQKDTQDVDNSTVTKLRPGLVLVRVETGDHAGKFVHVTHANAPAAEDIKEAVILALYHDMYSEADALEDQVSKGLIHGVVDDAQILWGTEDAPTIEAVKDVMTLVHFYTAVA